MGLRVGVGAGPVSYSRGMHRGKRPNGGLLFGWLVFLFRIMWFVCYWTARGFYLMVKWVYVVPIMAIYRAVYGAIQRRKQPIL